MPMKEPSLDSQEVRKGQAEDGFRAAEMAKHFFVSGIAVAVATGTTHPLDVVKVRLQIDNVGIKTTPSSLMKKFLSMINHEGVYSLYKGLHPSLMRSLTYGCFRLGLYEPSRQSLQWTFCSSGLLTNIAAGMIAGSIATAVTNPLDILKVRRQASTEQVCRGLRHDVRTIIAQEGVGGLWKGAGASMARASTLTASQFIAYEDSKKAIMRWLDVGDGFFVHLSASMIAGVFGTATTAPFDMLKTRLMMQMQTSHISNYKSLFDCAYKIWTLEGVRGFYKGWSAIYMRLGPQTAITFVVYEKMREFIGLSAL